MERKINKIFVATKNKNKLKEIKEILQDLNIDVSSAYDFIPENINIEETGKTFEENAAIKANAISNLLNDYVIADDSGLEVDALNGAPGIYSARFAGSNVSDNKNNEKLLIEMQNIPQNKRNAKFVCTIALSFKGKTIATFTGFCKGEIAFDLKGENGFGYDPLFLLPNGKRMAELNADEKNKISHRKKALEQLKTYLKDMNE
jgi:XTP/dITP diphosphohydrolase